MIDILSHLNQLRERIALAEKRFHRRPNSVSLLAVSKTQSPIQIAKLAQVGQLAFGENYVQEALSKISALNQKQLEWHFIGTIQLNKTAVLAEHFSWIHSVSRLSEAQKLAQFRPPHLEPLNILIQVKLDDSPKKSGIHPDFVPNLASKINQLPHLKLRGLMVLPPFCENFDEQRSYFRQLRLLMNQLNESHFQLDSLSMGMTHDLEAAIAEGATIVRIGQGLFGPREGKHRHV